MSGVGKKMAFGYPEQAARSPPIPDQVADKTDRTLGHTSSSRRDPKVAKRDQSSLSLQAEVSPLSKPSVNISSTSSGPATSELSPPDSDGSVMTHRACHHHRHQRCRPPRTLERRREHRGRWLGVFATKNNHQQDDRQQNSKPSSDLRYQCLEWIRDQLYERKPVTSVGGLPPTL